MIIGDSSALVALSIMDRLDLLESIFGKVYVPQAVYDEVTISHKPQKKQDLPQDPNKTQSQTNR